MITRNLKGKMNKGYFESEAIGSSDLGSAIVSGEPLSLNLDNLTVPIMPSAAMETGKQFEDLVEQAYGGIPTFTDKYFMSSLEKIPETTKKGLKGIYEILDGDDIIKDAEDGFVYTAGGKLSKTYESRHICLKEIEKHGFLKRPVSMTDQAKLKIMMKRFKNYPLQIAGVTKKMDIWLSGFEVEFQREFFWKHESGEECRAKFDILLYYDDTDGNKCVVALDMKVTGNYPAFMRNWRDKYIWQTVHYLHGLKAYCRENDFRAYPLMPYPVQESSEPHTTHCLTLDIEEIESLQELYFEAVEAIWKWKQDGKKIKGFMDQQTVNRWGKQV